MHYSLTPNLCGRYAIAHSGTRALAAAALILITHLFGAGSLKAQESCENLQYQLQIMRSNGGAGSWEGWVHRRMQELGCFGGGGYQSQPQLQYCSSGGTCNTDETCCGPYCCRPFAKCSLAGCIHQDATACDRNTVCRSGFKCSRGGGCVPEDSADCGGGSYCKSGRECWTASGDVPGLLKKGDEKCLTSEEQSHWDKRIADTARERREEKERATAEKKRKDEEEKRTAEQKKIDTNTASIQKDEYALRLEESKRRMEELTRQAQSEANARSARPANWAQQQPEALARGESVQSTPVARNAAPVTPTMSDPNSFFVLKPQLQEQRTISVPTRPPAAAATFMCGTPPNQYACPVSVGQSSAAPPPASPSGATANRDPFAPGLANTTTEAKAEDKGSIITTRKSRCTITSVSCGIFRKPSYKVENGKIPAAWVKSCEFCQETVVETCKNLGGLGRCTDSPIARNCRKEDRPSSYQPDAPQRLCTPEEFAN